MNDICMPRQLHSVTVVYCVTCLVIVAVIGLVPSELEARPHGFRASAFQKLYGDEGGTLTVDQIGRYEGIRTSAGGGAGIVDFHAYTYSDPNRIQLLVQFDRTLDEHNTSSSIALNSMTIDMDLERYHALFESKAPVNVPHLDGTDWQRSARARTAGSRRIVQFVEALAPGSKASDHGGPQKSKLTFIFNNGALAEVRLQKWADRFGSQPVFQGKLVECVCRQPGLALRDDVSLGRCRSAKAMNRAITTQLPEDYRAALSMD